MRYSLSFCDVIQLSDNVFETIDKDGIVIDKKCADEAWNFWENLRKEPFGLLVNCQNSYSFSFEGSCEIGKHPLQQFTAILVNNVKQQKAIESTMEIKKAVGHPYHHEIFYDRIKAIEWLRNSS